MHTIDALFDWFLSATTRGSLLILAVLLVQIALGKRMPAGWRHALWLPVLFVLGSPVLPPSPLSIENGWTAPGPAPLSFATELIPAESAAPALPMDSAPERQPIPWTTVAGWIWMSGAILAMLIGVISCAAALAGFRRRSRPLPVELHREIQDAARACGLRRVPRVLLSAAVPGPAMTGLVRPLLLLPASFEETFDREERRLILLHEFNHVKRGDLVVNGLVVCLQALHWCNPLVWFAFRRFRADRELACDSAVLAGCPGDDRSRYGHALLKVERAAHPVAWRLGFLGLVGLFGRGCLLASRIHAIAGHRRAHSLWTLAGPALLLAIGLTGATRAQNEAAAPGPQMVIESRFVEVPADRPVTLEAVRSTLDSKNGITVFQGDPGVMEQVLSIPDADVLSSPTLVTQSGTKGTIEIGTPVPNAPEKPKFVGTRLEVLPTLAGEKVRLELRVHRTKQNTTGGSTTFSESEIKTDLTVDLGDTLVITSLHAKADPPSPSDKQLMVMVSVRLADNGALVEDRLEKIIIPTIELRDTPLTEALAFLRQQARDLDPEKRGINLLHIPAEGVPDPLITVSFKEIPLSEALKYLAVLSGLEVEFGDPAVVFRTPAPKPVLSPDAAVETAKVPMTVKPSGKSADLAASITLPEFVVEEASLPSVLQFLQQKSLELDPAKKGLNLILNAPGDPAPGTIRINLSLRNVPLSEAIRYVAELANLKLRYDEDAVVLFRE